MATCPSTTHRKMSSTPITPYSIRIITPQHPASYPETTPRAISHARTSSNNPNPAIIPRHISRIPQKDHLPSVNFYLMELILPMALPIILSPFNQKLKAAKWLRAPFKKVLNYHKITSDTPYNHLKNLLFCQILPPGEHRE